MTIASIDEWGDNPARPPAGELPEPLLQRFLAQAARQGKEIERLKAENEALKADYADCESVGMEWMRRAWRAECLLEGVRRPELSARNFRVDL